VPDLPDDGGRYRCGDRRNLGSRRLGAGKTGDKAENPFANVGAAIAGDMIAAPAAP
jgi:hypothetical protein